MDGVKIDYQAVATIVVMAVVAGVAVVKSIDKVFGLFMARRKRKSNGGSAPPPQCVVDLQRINKAVHDQEDVPISANVKWLKEETKEMGRTLEGVSKAVEKTTMIQERILDKLDS